MEPSGPGVRVDVAGAVVYLVLVHVEAGNAFTLDSSREFLAAVDRVGSLLEAGCLVIRAEGPRFCVGATYAASSRHRSVRG